MVDKVFLSVVGNGSPGLQCQLGKRRESKSAWTGGFEAAVVGDFCFCFFYEGRLCGGIYQLVQLYENNVGLNVLRPMPSFPRCITTGDGKSTTGIPISTYKSQSEIEKCKMSMNNNVTTIPMQIVADEQMCKRITKKTDVFDRNNSFRSCLMFLAFILSCTRNKRPLCF